MKRADKEIVLVTGACRSGKSTWARRWAEEKGEPRLFLATARASDHEMEERIRRHKEERGPGWITVEEPLHVAEVIETKGRGAGVILLDCITLWVSNLLLEGASDDEVVGRVHELGTSIEHLTCSVALVSNEVGWGVIPDNPLGRRFRDLAGAVNQILARMADRVILMVAGIPMTLK